MSIQELFHPNPFNLWVNNLTVEGTLTAPSFVPVIANLALTGNLSVAGSTTLNTLSVTGTSTHAALETFNGGIQANAPGISASNITVGPGQLITNGGLQVNGTATFSNGIMVTGPAQLNNGLTVTGPSQLNGGLTVNGNTTLNNQAFINDAQLTQISEGSAGVPITGNVAIALFGDGINAQAYQFQNNRETNIAGQGIFNIIDTTTTNNHPLSAVLAIQQTAAMFTNPLTSTYAFLCTNAAETLPPYVNGITFWISADGTANSPNFNVFSSAEYKKNIIPKIIDSKQLKNISVNSYHLKSEPDSSEKHLGVLWEEINKICPEVCVNGNSKMINIGGLASLSISLLKHAEERISKLEESLAALQAQVNLKQ
jgi:hypothetical protein